MNWENNACSEKVATDCLKATGWSVEGAIEYFFSSGLAASVSGIDPRAVDSLYNKYKGGANAVCIIKGKAVDALQPTCVAWWTALACCHTGGSQAPRRAARFDDHSWCCCRQG